MKHQYESDFKINDFVEVAYGDAGYLKNCCVMGIHFRQGGHVFYDLAVLTHTDDDGTQNWQRLYKVPGGIITLVGRCPKVGAECDNFIWNVFEKDLKEKYPTSLPTEEAYQPDNLRKNIRVIQRAAAEWGAKWIEKTGGITNIFPSPHQ